MDGQLSSIKQLVVLGDQLNNRQELWQNIDKD